MGGEIEFQQDLKEKIILKNCMFTSCNNFPWKVRYMYLYLYPAAFI